MTLMFWYDGGVIELDDSYQDALRAWQVALNHFDNADPEHIDIAIHELKAAELRLGSEIKRLKMEVNNDDGEDPGGTTKA